MSYSSEEETDISDFEMEDYSEKYYQKLRDGIFEVIISRDVYRCPYCSRKKRKQRYGFKDLREHASAFAEGSGFERNTKEKGKHLGLKKYLQSLGQRNALEIISPQLLKHSQNNDDNELRVYPLVGIVANIPVTFDENGNYVCKSSKLKSEFTAKGFDPVRVTPLWNYKCHICFAVLEFSKGWQGFNCAMKFEKSFEISSKGKPEYLQVKHWGTDIYGWIGQEDDYHSEKAFGDFLRKFGELKTVKEIKEEEKCISIQSLSNLSNVIVEENMQLEEIEGKYSETLVSIINLITEKDKMLEAYNKDFQKGQWNLQLQKIELEQREKEVQKREACNHSERKKLVLAKEMNERAALEQKKKADETMIKLGEDHKREKEELGKRRMELKNQIDGKQGLELEIEHLKGVLSVMNQMEDQRVQVNLKIGDTQKALHFVEKELNYLEARNKTLVVTELETNGKLQEVRKELIDFWKRGKSSEWIGIKGMGVLDANVFHAACKQKYADSEAEEKAVELCSLWEDHLRDSNWHPFKIITLESGNIIKEIIDEEDEKLKLLKAEWGSEIQMAVITALMEMNEYNPSGRYITWELWNHNTGRKATLGEVVSYLLDLRSKRRRKSDGGRCRS